MNNRLVYVPVSYKEGYSMSAQIKRNNKYGAEIYLKNAFVMLNSVKKYNPNVDLALIVNFSLSDFFKNLFESCNINVYQIEFSDYIMPPDFTWSMAFFKIAALKWINSNTDYEYSLQLETDMLCINNFDDMWNELDSSILTMFDPFRFNHPGRKKYTDVFNMVYENTKNSVVCLTGAGFIAGKKDNLAHFVGVCDKIYDVLKDNLHKVDIKIGDELYTSLYCAAHPELVKPANPYMDIYWTGNYYLVSTNYYFDPVSILHLPDEKQISMLILYNYCLKKGRMPKNEFIFKLLGLPRAKKPFSAKKFFMHIKRKLILSAKK